MDNLLIQRIEICNSRGTAGINYQGTPQEVPWSKRLYIRECWVHGIVPETVIRSYFPLNRGRRDECGRVGDVHIVDNTIERPGRHGYEGGGNCRDQYFIGNTIDMANCIGSSGGLSGINPTGGNTTVIMGNTIKSVEPVFRD